MAFWAQLGAFGVAHVCRSMYLFNTDRKHTHTHTASSNNQIITNIIKRSPLLKQKSKDRRKAAGAKKKHRCAYSAAELDF